MENCCICGRDLPNRYAVAGKCNEPSCVEPFCSLHWAKGNHFCEKHGYEIIEDDSKGQSMNSNDATENNKKDKKVDAAKVKKAMKEALNITMKLGAGASELLKKLKKDKSPEAMIATLESHVSANTERRESVSGRLERLYNDIAVRKKAFATAPMAKKRIIEAELKSMLSTYKAAERELNILLENERNLALVKGRLNEVLAYGMAGVSEIMIDDIIDDIEDSASDAEAINDASRELEKAGKRRDRDEDGSDLWAELDGFGDEEPISSGDESDSLDDFDIDPPAPAEDKKIKEPAE